MGFLCLWSTPHRTPLSFEFDASKFVSPVSRKTNLDTNDFDSTVYLHTPSRSRITKSQNDRLIQIDCLHKIRLFVHHSLRQASGKNYARHQRRLLLWM